MAIQDEIYKLIEKEIDETLEKGKEKKRRGYTKS